MQLITLLVSVSSRKGWFCRNSLKSAGKSSIPTPNVHVRGKLVIFTKSKAISDEHKTFTYYLKHEKYQIYLNRQQ